MSLALLRLERELWGLLADRWQTDGWSWRKKWQLLVQDASHPSQLVVPLLSLEIAVHQLAWDDVWTKPIAVLRTRPVTARPPASRAEEKAAQRKRRSAGRAMRRRRRRDLSDSEAEEDEGNSGVEDAAVSAFHVGEGSVEAEEASASSLMFLGGKRLVFTQSLVQVRA